jgi:hypothetical protein
MHQCAHVCVWLYVWMCVWLCVRMCVRMCVWLCVWIWVCMCCCDTPGVTRWSQWEHAPFTIENFTITTDTGAEVPWDLDFSGARAMHEQFYVQGVLGQVRGDAVAQGGLTHPHPAALVDVANAPVL